jgi:nucleoside-diphosphate-sugar epimerase
VTESALTVAVTGPTGTFGAGLMPLLQREERVSRVVGIARRPFDPAGRGWTKLTYRRGDVRELDALREAFLDADVVVHLAFLITGSGSPDTTRAINVGGTLNAFRAARDAGARRFVYASSVAAYGFHPDNPVGMREDWPVRPSAQLFYAREKAELEQLLRTEAEQYPELAVYLLRPSIVLGPHAVGGKDLIPGWLAPAARRALGQLARLPIPLPMPAPRMPLQFVHERDVGQALCRCVLGDGPPGAYNIAGDGVLTVADVARELGGWPMPLPGAPIRAGARALAGLPFLPQWARWLEAASHPAIMDTTRAKRDLGWRPDYTGLEALRDTLRVQPNPGTQTGG